MSMKGLHHSVASLQVYPVQSPVALFLATASRVVASGQSLSKFSAIHPTASPTLGQLVNSTNYLP